MEKAIKKAIEGGWRGFGKSTETAILTNYTTVSNPNNYFLLFADGSEVHIGVVLIDRYFWQALGKAEGWSVMPHYNSWLQSGGRNEIWGPEYMLYWHRFISHLNEGKDVCSFFNELLR